MKVVVIGPGALGCLLAATLARNAEDLDLWLLDHRKSRALTVARQGLVLEEREQLYRFQIQATADVLEIGGSADLIFLCVKAHDIVPSLERLTPLLVANTLLVTFQNGIAHLPIMSKLNGNFLWAVGVTSQGATLIGPGHVRHGGRGITRLGFLDPSPEEALSQLHEAAALLNKVGIETEVVANIIEHVWNKLLVNVGINPLTAILSCSNGNLLESATAEARLEAAVREAANVAKAKGIKVVDDPVALTKKVCHATRDNHSSMLQDVLNKRPTEIDAINGAVVEAAKELGIAVPVNEKLVSEVKEVEKGYL